MRGKLYRINCVKKDESDSSSESSDSDSHSNDIKLTETEKIAKMESESGEIRDIFRSGREQNRKIRIVTINRIARVENCIPHTKG